MPLYSIQLDINRILTSERRPFMQFIVQWQTESQLNLIYLLSKSESQNKMTHQWASLNKSHSNELRVQVWDVPTNMVLISTKSCNFVTDEDLHDWKTPTANPFSFVAACYVQENPDKFLAIAWASPTTWNDHDPLSHHAVCCSQHLNNLLTLSCMFAFRFLSHNFRCSF